MSTDSGPPSADCDRARLTALEAEVAALRAQLREKSQLEASLRESEDRFRALITSLQVGVVVQGAQAEILLCNRVSLEFLGLTEEEYLGRTSFDPRWRIVDDKGRPFDGAQRPVAQVLRTRREVRDVVMGIYRPRSADWAWLLVNAVPQLDDRGEVQQVVSTFTDITALRQAEARTRELTQELLALSTPCIPIANGVVIMPLIGRFDQARCEHALGALLQYVATHRVRTVLLDLTGLVVADRQVATTLEHIVRGIALLGAPVLLSGIRADLAKDLCKLDNALANVPTYSTLQPAVVAALAHAPQGRGKMQ